jgi:hypothetical protein
MKKTILVLIVLAVCISVLYSQYDFRKVKWGWRPEQVKRAESKLGVVLVGAFRDDFGNPITPMFLSTPPEHPVYIAGYDVKLTYEFDPYKNFRLKKAEYYHFHGKGWAVEPSKDLYWEDWKKARVFNKAGIEAKDKLVRMLTSRYGSPKRLDRYKYIWTKGTMTVTLYFNLIAIGSRKKYESSSWGTSFTITYMNNYERSKAGDDLL